MTHQMTVAVTQRDIDESRGHIDAVNGQCPIERALERRGIRAIVTPFAVMDLRDSRRRADLPSRAKAFVRAFDNNEAVKPIRFPLEF